MIEEILLYDYSISDFSLEFLVLSLTLILSGFSLIFFGKKIKIQLGIGQISIFGFKQLLGANNQNKITTSSKWIGVLLLLPGFIIFNADFIEHIKKRNIEYFENIKTLSGEIHSFSKPTVFNKTYISFSVRDKNFSIIRDKYYIGERDIYDGIKVKIEYFESKLLDDNNSNSINNIYRLYVINK